MLLLVYTAARWRYNDTTIPKHKGTERLQADIKTRIKHLTEDLAGPKKAGGRGGPSQMIRPEGAAQIALLGPPNTGKSLLHDRLTGSHAEVGAYPFTTQSPLPGMLPHEDVLFQLIDLPPISREHPVPWIANGLQPADGCMLVVDLQDPGCVDHILAIQELLGERRITLLETWDNAARQREEEVSEEEFEDPFAIQLPTLLVSNKCDLLANVEQEVEVFEQLLGVRYPVISVSAKTGEGLESIGPWLFDALRVVRVYTKTPGRALGAGQPFTLRRGHTVYDVALLVHRDIAAGLKYARLWGSGQFSGQQVGKDHPVSDGDIIELHA